MEKAAPEVMNVLLQLLDEGRLTDGKGHTVDCRNTLVIMTSNLATEALRSELPEAEKRAQVDKALRSFFRPEFLNRLDDIVLFRALTPKDIEGIVDLQLQQVEARLKERRVRLKVTADAKKLLAEAGFDSEFGARPLRRTVQRLVVDPLTTKLLEGGVRDGSEVLIDAKDGVLRVQPGGSGGTRKAKAEAPSTPTSGPEDRSTAP